MAKSIKLPFDVNPSGNAKTAINSDSLYQDILLGILPSSSLHPWNQRLTPPDDIIFNIADDSVGGLFESYVYDYFEQLERLNLASISKGADGITIDGRGIHDGEIRVIVKYTDLEDNSSREIIITQGK